ncbi:MAG: C69 family dipeptidase [Bacteroidales bacterium]|nr:C69 family dipeptidase [Bacteroidales bacterium]
MKSFVRLTIVAAALVALTGIRADACTNIIVTKGASADGSCMVSYAADSHQLFGELYFHKAADWPAGAMLDVNDWDSGRYLGKIKQTGHTWQTVGNINEKQVIIGETTFGGREELVNPDGIVDYGSLIYITLQRAKSAREAIRIIDELLQEYGYPSEGESFSIADKNEAWIMEIVGKGKIEKGAVWVAIRIPDGYVCAHANQSRIHHFPLNDPANCLYAPDVISFARKAGYFDGKDEDFSFCDTYCPADFSGLRACEARVWAAFRLLGGENFDAAKYLDFAMGHNAANKMPLYIKPAKPVSVKDVAEVMRDHFEGTALDFSEDMGAGPSRLPYRWRPMGFELDGQNYVMERSIATQQTGFWFVAQARGWLPDEVGAVTWFGVDDAASSPLTPIYVSINAVPKCFAEGNGSMLEYSPTSAFWLMNRVAHYEYLFYDRVAPEIRAKIDEYESENVNLLAAQDAKMARLLEAGNLRSAKTAMTEFCANRTEEMMKRWENLSNYLLVKYMDGNIKRQNDDGSFKDNGSGKNIPASPIHPKFRERWLRGIVNDHGEVIKKVEPKR